MNYLTWLMLFVCQHDHGIQNGKSYHKLFRKLLNEEFISLVKNDDNRADDGLRLRIEYEETMGLSCEMLGPCSVLEALIALAIRCENDIMYDPDEGDRTDIWFWEMMKNLNLEDMYDTNFDEEKVEKNVSRFVKRMYCHDGRGGIFFIPGFRKDMRKIELWYQLSYYLENNFL